MNELRAREAFVRALLRVEWRWSWLVLLLCMFLLISMSDHFIDNIIQLTRVWCIEWTLIDSVKQCVQWDILETLESALFNRHRNEALIFVVASIPLDSATKLKTNNVWTWKRCEIIDLQCWCLIVWMLARWFESRCCLNSLDTNCCCVACTQEEKVSERVVPSAIAKYCVITFRWICFALLFAFDLYLCASLCVCPWYHTILCSPCDDA